MTVYCLSGLGVDSRAFDRIEIPNTTFVHIPWISPRKSESLKAYAKRLFEITSPTEDYAVIGVSFGGMIAQEWAKIRKPKALILISTASSYKQVKRILRIPGKLGLYRLLHIKLATTFSFVTNTLFGTKTMEDKRQLKDILHDTDAKFLRWATGALLRWWSEPSLTSVNIHGKNDKMIASPERVDFETDGGHFTIFTDGLLISDFIRESLQED